MQIRAYPDRHYSCHGELQRKITEYVAFARRVTIGCMLVLFGIMLASLVKLYLIRDTETSLLGPALTIVGILALFLIIVNIYRPHPKCPLCNSKLKRQYIGKQRGSGEDLYIVCHTCKIYADAHLERE